MRMIWVSPQGSLLLFSIMMFGNAMLIITVLVKTIYVVRWYGNNCICADHCISDACYENDVKAIVDYGFDSVKLDGCGKQVGSFHLLSVLAIFI
jgi:hypothetical protein